MRKSDPRTACRLSGQVPEALGNSASARQREIDMPPLLGRQCLSRSPMKSRWPAQERNHEREENLEIRAIGRCRACGNVVHARHGGGRRVQRPHQDRLVRLDQRQHQRPHSGRYSGKARLHCRVSDGGLPVLADHGSHQRRPHGRNGILGHDGGRGHEGVRCHPPDRAPRHAWPKGQGRVVVPALHEGEVPRSSQLGGAEGPGLCRGLLHA